MPRYLSAVCQRVCRLSSSCLAPACLIALSGRRARPPGRTLGHDLVVGGAFASAAEMNSWLSLGVRRYYGELGPLKRKSVGPQLRRAALRSPSSSGSSQELSRRPCAE
jgi:hypothetical protein